MTEEAVDQVVEGGDGLAGGEVNEIEAKARRMGWIDQSEFRGRQDHWVDAETYIARADEHLPILKGTVAAMNKRMAAQEALIAEQNERIKAMQSDFKEFVGFTRAAEDRAYKKALAELKAEQRQAVEDQDLERFDKVSAEIDSHLKQNPASGAIAVDDPAKAPGGGTVAWSEEVYNSWLVENEWYLEQPKMAVYAKQLDDWLTSTKPQLAQKAKLAEITKLVKVEFPDYWPQVGATEKKVGSARPSPVEGSDAGGVVQHPSKRGYANLPAEAKVACDKFCGKDGKGESGTIPGYTREQYLKDYDWEG